MEPNSLGLPYKEFTILANRDIRRAHSTRGGREAVFICFDQIKERDGFNIRKQYDGIPEFANFININGLPDPLYVDMEPDGTCYVEIGYRRYRSLKLLDELGLLSTLDAPGIRPGKMIECFINDSKIDELTRLKRQYSSNAGVNYTPLELGELCKRMQDYFKMNMTEIAQALGFSRQTVKNYITLAEQPDSIKQAIGSKNITPTAAIDLAHKITDGERRSAMVQEAVSSGSAISVSDVKRLEGEDSEGNAKGEKDERGETFDESRDEIRKCQNVIKLLDKVNNMVSKSDNEGLKTDVDKTIGWIQKDMEDIRKYIKETKKQ